MPTLNLQTGAESSIPIMLCDDHRSLCVPVLEKQLRHVNVAAYPTTCDRQDSLQWTHLVNTFRAPIGAGLQVHASDRAKSAFLTPYILYTYKK